MRHGIILAAVLGIAMLPAGVAHGAQLDAEITGDSSRLEPSFKFLRVVHVGGLEDGALSESMSDGTIEFAVSSSDADLSGLVAQINESIAGYGSTATVTDVRLHYKAAVARQADSASIEYSIEIVPTIRNHIAIDGTSVSIDSKWRGFVIDGPVVVETEQYGSLDVNSPAAALGAALPEYADAGILSIPLIDAGGISDMPLAKWDYLFDPTPIQRSADDYGYDGGGVVISQYSMGLCHIGTGLCSDREWTGAITLDKEYAVSAVESQDDAVIEIEGYTKIDPATEAIVITQGTEPVIGLQAMVMYGMSGAGAGGAAVFMLYSSRRSRSERGAGQTGIDPARLHVRETSLSAGGYRTNRGESYLAGPPQNRSPV